MKHKVKFAALFLAMLTAAPAFTQEAKREIPPKGSIFNESVWMVDSVTGRPTLRLTQYRDRNCTPTYHLNACFSEDSRYVVFTTSSTGYGSAIIKADVSNGDCQVIAASGPKEKNLGGLCIIHKTDYLASTSGGKIMLYNLKTLEERELYNAPKGDMFSQVTSSADGKKIYFNQLRNDTDKGELATNRMSIVEVDIASGRSQVIFADTSRGKHVVANPVYPDLLLIDRDFPPRFSHGSNSGKTTRVWILNIKTGALTECRPNNSSRFQTHSNWSYDGKYVYYHGVARKKNAHYIGVTDLDGKVVWEGTFPYFYYGHMCSHTQKHALFTDGLLFPNLITELDWTKPDKNNVPPVLIYGAHNSGSYKFGQHAHPHCHMSPDAQKITYNKGDEKRSDVYILFTDQAATSGVSNRESMESLITNRLDRSVRQYKLMAQSLIDQPDKFPRSIDAEGALVTSGSSWWCSGYVPGSLWYLYQYSHNPDMLEYAKNYTARVENEKYNTKTHDVGLMLYCSFGNGYRLTGDTAYRSVMLTGAESLVSRFNPTVGSIQSWNSNRKWKFPVIIDNMMNLEFLFWASKVSGDPKYRNICVSHADVTIRNFFRSDYSSYHVVSFDPAGGKPDVKNTHQGYSDESAWARGQAWGLYGYVVMYRETKDVKYLEQAKNIAAFILNHPNLPADKIPYWDFNTPDIPNALRDASAGAIMASALVELSQYVDTNSAKTYLDVAEMQIRTLSSPEYFAEMGTNGHFILKHSVGFLPKNSEVDVPLTYADYYYIEALLRYQALLEKQLTAGKK